MTRVIYVVKIYASKNRKDVSLNYCNTEFKHYNENYKQQW
jgi:hypothetical protein